MLIVVWIVKEPTPWLPPPVLLKNVTGVLPAVTLSGYEMALTGQVLPLHDGTTVTAVIIVVVGRVRWGVLVVVNWVKAIVTCQLLLTELLRV